MSGADLQGQNVNDLINSGVIAPRNGGQAYEFLQNWSNPNPATAAAPLPSSMNTGNTGAGSIVSSTTGLRDNGALVTGAANDLYSALNGTGTPTLNDINALRESINGAPVATDQSQIDAAGAAAGSQYNESIREARDQKQQGMAKNLVNAGERGGFMNTQYAGNAALVPTNGKSFVGAGGQLNEQASAYDRNIQDLIDKQNRAITMAKNAAIAAIKSGKQDDFNNALTAYNLGVSVQDKIDAAKATQTANMDKDRATAQDKINYLVSTMGAGALVANPSEILGLAQQAGYEPTAFLSALTAHAKEEADAEKKKGVIKPELQMVKGSLYSVTYDSDGHPTAKLLVQGAPGSSGSSGSGPAPTSTGQFTESQILDPKVQGYVDNLEAGKTTMAAVPKAYVARVQEAWDNRKSVGGTAGDQYVESPVIQQQRIKNAVNASKNVKGNLSPEDFNAILADIQANYPDQLDWFNKEYGSESYFTMKPNANTPIDFTNISFGGKKK